jgi:ABC-type transport system involved in multi-copper enzyme maturation permease subunit
MKRLIRIEYLKNLSYRPFKIFSLIYLSAVVIIAFVGFAEFNLGFVKFKLKDIGIYNFPNVWHFTAYILSLLKIFLAAIIVFSISQEFSNRMFKQNVIDGLSKGEFLVSKIYTISIFSGISTLFVALISLLLGLKYSNEFSIDQVFSEIYFVGLYFLKILLFLLMFLFLTVLFRNSIFPFLTVFVLWVVEGILSASKWLGNIYEYLPLTTISRIVEAPFNRVNLNMSGEGGGFYSINPSEEFPTFHLFIALFYIVLFILATYEILKKRDW